MLIYPTIELQNSKPVSLYRGNLDEPQIWHVNPLEKALEFARAGAEWIHITDFDAIADQGNSNNDLIENMIAEVPASFQVGGGIRSMQRIEEWIEAGAGRVVLGTVATLNPDLVKEAAKFFPDQIVLAVDVIDGHIASHGWKEKTAYLAEDFIRLFEEDPLAGIVVSDINVDLDLNEDSLGLIAPCSGNLVNQWLCRMRVICHKGNREIRGHKRPDKRGKGDENAACHDQSRRHRKPHQRRIAARHPDQRHHRHQQRGHKGKDQCEMAEFGNH